MIYQLFDNIELVGDTVFDILFGNTDYYEMISTDDFTDVILQKNMSSYVKYQKSFCQSFFFLRNFHNFFLLLVTLLIHIKSGASQN